MKKLKIKKGDQVVVIAGRDKGKKGEVLKVLPKEDRVVVSGINVAKRHQKQTATEQAGIKDQDQPIHISNVALADPKTGKPTKVGFKTLDNNEKSRFARKSGEVVN